MAGRIGSVQRAQDGQSYGFVIYDQMDRASTSASAPGTTQTGRHAKRRGC
jgi:hypothetical protein